MISYLSVCVGGLFWGVCTGVKVSTEARGKDPLELELQAVLNTGN